MSSLPSGPPRPQAAHLAEFEDMYGAGRQPFDYDARAVEVLRHELVARLARGLAPPGGASPGAGAGRVLDLGCGLGHVTARLAGGPGRLLAADLSPTAVARARRRLGAAAPPLLAASALELPLRSGALALVVASDGLVSWHLNGAQRAAALGEMVRVLEPGGHALLTEYLRPAQWPEFLSEVRESGLEVLRADGIHDRPCYWFESWIRAVRDWAPARRLRRSRGFAQALLAAGRLLGRRACRHLVVVARRP